MSVGANLFAVSLHILHACHQAFSQLTASAIAGGGHPLEIPEPHPSDSAGERIVWVLISAVVGTLVFVAIHLFLERIRDGRPSQPESEKRLGLAGAWIDESGTISAFIPEKAAEAWLLIVRTQGYKLLVDSIDPRKGVAAGFIACSNNGHRVGHWDLSPAKDNLNRFLLQLFLDNGNQQSFILFRAE